jgi:hypothetical protein
MHERSNSEKKTHTHRHARVSNSIPQGQLVMKQYSPRGGDYLGRKLRERLKHTMPDVYDRVVILSALSDDKYLALLKVLFEYMPLTCPASRYFLNTCAVNVPCLKVLFEYMCR